MFEVKNNRFGVSGGQRSQILDFDYVSAPVEVVFEKLNTSAKGLSEVEAEKRLEEYGYNEPARKKKRTIFFQILSKFVNPLVIVLLIIAGFSLFFGEKISALLVVLMAIMSVFLSFIQEYRAGKKQRSSVKWCVPLQLYIVMAKQRK